MTQSPDLFPFLALCARVPGIPAQYEQLRQRVSNLSSWDEVLIQAEQHGLIPLLYLHLHAAGISIPPRIEQQLQTRTMQHAHANRVRDKALAEILAAFYNAGIQALVLKGAALAHLVYPRPGLRVMRDVDVLVSQSEAERAQSLLAQMGFNPPLNEPVYPTWHRHLQRVQREIDGILVTLEVHRRLYDHINFNRVMNGWSPSALENQNCATTPFVLEGTIAFALNCTDMLAHVYHNLMEDNFVGDFRLIEWADLISVAERFVNEMNWRRIPPSVRNALGMIHPLTPLSDNLICAASIKGEDSPKEIDKRYFWKYQGWPVAGATNVPVRNYPAILRDTFYPQRWWLRFYYGLNQSQVVLPGRLVLHPLNWLLRLSKVLLARARRRMQMIPVRVSSSGGQL